MSGIVCFSTTMTNSLQKRKRATDDSDSQDEMPSKKPTMYTLAPESVHSSGSGTESIWSVQNKSTDFADSPLDTTSSEGPQPLAAGSPKEVFKKVSTGSSRNTSVNDSVESEEDLKWKFEICLWCNKKNSDSNYRFCQKCFSIRKTFFPSRPCRKQKSKMSLEQLAYLSTDSGFRSLNSQSILETSDDAKTDSSADLCNICYLKSKDGGFCHGNKVHVYACYKCSVKVFKQCGRCPICNIKARQIFKIVFT